MASEHTASLPKEKMSRPWEREWEGRQVYVEKMDQGAHLHALGKVLCSKDTSFQKVDVYETLAFGKLLVLDGDPQSSEHDEDIYHEALVHPALVTHPRPQSVLILGGGEGATLREVLRHPGIKKVTMVDIDGEVVKICQKELPGYSKGTFMDSRLHLVIDDAKVFLQETQEIFDAVISDLTEPHPESPTHGLLTADFFRSIKKRMKPDGVFAMQASHATRGKNKLHVRHIETLKTVWKMVRPYRAFVPSFYSEWGYILASDTHDPLNLSKEAVDARLASFSSQLRYYDGAIHHAIFTVLKELRQHIL